MSATQEKSVVTLKDIKPNDLGIITLKKYKENKHYLEIDSNHVSKIMFDRVKQNLAPIYHTGTRAFITGLTNAEETWFEAHLGLKVGELSKYNEEFWSNPANYVQVDKKGTKLNPDENLYDLLKWKWLSVHRDVASSKQAFEDEYSTKTYLLESEMEVTKVRARAVSKQVQASKRFSSMSVTDKKDFMTSLGVKITKDQTEDDFDIYIMDNYISAKPDEFVELLDHEDYQLKIKIYKAVASNIMIKRGTKYLLEDGEQIGSTLQQTIDYLKDSANQDVLHLIDTRLKINGKKEK